jgi:hypothetical protein
MIHEPLRDTNDRSNILWIKRLACSPFWLSEKLPVPRGTNLPDYRRASGDMGSFLWLTGLPFRSTSSVFPRIILHFGYVLNKILLKNVAYLLHSKHLEPSELSPGPHRNFNVFEVIAHMR